MIKWYTIWFGLFASLILFYIPYGGWIFAPFIGGAVSGFFSSSGFKKRVISGLLVGLLSPILWFIISSVHWGGWYFFIMKIGWLSENALNHFSSTILFNIAIFTSMYILFGTIGGFTGGLIKYYFKK